LPTVVAVDDEVDVVVARVVGGAVVSAGAVVGTTASEVVVDRFTPPVVRADEELVAQAPIVREATMIPADAKTPLAAQVRMRRRTVAALLCQFLVFYALVTVMIT
jgi:hypothetical protein